MSTELGDPISWDSAKGKGGGDSACSMLKDEVGWVRVLFLLPWKGISGDRISELSETSPETEFFFWFFLDVCVTAGGLAWKIVGGLDIKLGGEKKATIHQMV